MIRKIQKIQGNLFTIFILIMLAGCGLMSKESNELGSGVPTPPLQVQLDERASSPVVKSLSVAKPPSRCGNEPSYTLNGRSYQVLPSVKGYRKEGMASRYGSEYQGTATAGCETYDRHAFTAAHRTLPLPSFVRVTNLQNDKSVIVKVNDRGPFENNGLIQLSSAAAGTLGMSAAADAIQVRVEAVGVNKAATGKPIQVDRQTQADISVARSKSQAVDRTRRKVVASPRSPKQPGSAQAAAIKKAKQSGKNFYVVVKNYQNQADALDMFVRLTSVGLSKTEMASAINKGRRVHQVRIGPLYTQDQIDSIKDALASNGLATFKVVEVGE